MGQLLTATRLDRPSRSRLKDLTGLAVSLAAVGAVAFLGGIAAAKGVDGFYATLRKPSWTPPNAVFGPVWTALYTAMAVAAWRVWRTQGASEARPALLLYAVQLVANLAWSPLFFGAGQQGPALAVIVLLDVLVAATLYEFAKYDTVAALLIAPYLAWVLYATTLNAGIVVLN